MPTKIAACAEESLERSTSSSFPELAVLLLDKHGEISAISEEAKSVLGVSDANPSVPTALLDLIADLARSFETQRSKELVLKTRGGSPVTVEVTTQRVSAAGQDRVAVILSASRKTPESELLRLHRLASAGTLSATLAHEIKNALVAGKTFIDTLLDKHQDTELAGIARHELQRIDSLVSQMLRFTGPMKRTRAPVPIHHLIDLSLRLLQAQFKTKSILIQKSLDAPRDLIHGDEQQLEQALLNLLLNSVEAMGPNGTIAISTAVVSATPDQLRSGPASAKSLEIRITDDGAGITLENLSRLFEPFFTTKKNGSGLGLAITRKIIKEHGGEICAESEPPDGATFRILLPLTGD
jgi:two-component system, NtrC family, sensor histidine kinase HydH